LIKCYNIPQGGVQVDKDVKEQMIENLKLDIIRLTNEIEQDIISKDNGSEQYIKFLNSVSEFIRWTGQKYKYKYEGDNSRVVKKGEIYFCDLGENIGSEQSGNRPVVVLQNDTGNMKGPTTIIAPITNSKKKLPVHVPLADVAEGLKTTGVIRLEHIREISKCRLGIYIEKLDINSEGWKKVERAIKKSLDLK